MKVKNSRQLKGAQGILLKNKNIKIIFELNIAYQENGIEFANQIFTELKRLNFSNFQALLEPRIFIKDLNNLEDVELLKQAYTKTYEVVTNADGKTKTIDARMTPEEFTEKVEREFQEYREKFMQQVTKLENQDD